MIMTTLTSNIKGYRRRGYYGLEPHRDKEIISLPLAGARFLTFWELIKEDLPKYSKLLVENILTPSPVFLKMKEFGWVS